MSPIALKAFHKIITLRKYPLPQSAIAEQRILKSLNVPDFTAVVEALDPETAGIDPLKYLQ